MSETTVIGRFSGHGDIGLALGIIAILVMLILPMPAIMLDMALAISITFSVLILMTALFIHTPLEFSSFPTILLIATMMRLALNIASTRLILSHGHEGTSAAGQVIEAFGHFVMQGNFIIGIIVFSILVLVNFVVITKGSGRIAEVAARFTLDAMPGKQMAIDADLSAGLINEEQAKERRSRLENESSFFGAMDGASKFVRGDAVAGLLITLINIVGGIVIGVGQNDLSFTDAAQTYTLLTIGDGLVSQVPALVVSTAAGLLVSKAGVDGAADKALTEQLSGYPKALSMSAFLMILMAMLPGIPVVPFLALGSGAAFLAWQAFAKKKRKTIESEQIEMARVEQEVAAPAEEPIKNVLKIDDLRLELGYALIPMIKDGAPDGDRLTEQIKALRRQLAADMGFVMPSVRILDNVHLGANDYIIKVKEVDAGDGMIYPGQYLVMDPMGQDIDLPGIRTTEPTFGLPAKWITTENRDDAQMKGYTVVDPVTVVSTHLTEILKNNMSDLLSYTEVNGLLDNLTADQKRLLNDIVPDQINITGIQRILQNLLKERISIRDLPTILEGIAEATIYTNNAQSITEHVRTRLARQISASYTNPDGTLAIISMHPQWEQEFAETIIGEGDDRQLAMAPSRLQGFIRAVAAAFEEASANGDYAVLLTSPAARPFVRSIVERFRPQTAVLSQGEIHPQARIKTAATVPPMEDL
ncbi:MAG: flagellar biosynthesis protein FlhA [Rhodomicrobium sp.]|nr:MAG: flagellar biosynthesis protein FlhA [Rhodomicrobium sp.]